MHEKRQPDALNITSPTIITSPCSVMKIDIKYR
eukprot:UN27258